MSRNKYFELENKPSRHTEGLVYPLAQRLTANELALMLIEENRFTADTLSEHRFQSIFVGRGNQVYEFPRDLGPSSHFPDVQGFLIFSGGVDTVAQLMDMAEEERGLNKMQKVLEEVKANSTLIEDAVKETEQRHQLVKRNERTLRVQHGIVHERTVF